MAPTRKEVARRKQLAEARAANRHIVRAEMMRRGYNGSRLTKELGCSNALISKVLTGQSHSPLVLDALRRIGVPDEYLYDPRGDAAREKEAV